MNYLVTGASGFVMSNVALRLLKNHTAAQMVLLDLNPFDDLMQDFFDGYSDRVEFLQTDIAAAALPGGPLDGRCFTHIVHGAAVTHDKTVEYQTPDRYLDVNLGGTVGLLNWIRRHGLACASKSRPVRLFFEAQRSVPG